MEQRERKEGTGVLLTNQRKKGAGPDWKGEIRVERAYAAGEVIKLAGWTKESAVGVLISLKEDNWRPTQENNGNVNPIPAKRMDDEDVPF